MDKKGFTLIEMLAVIIIIGIISTIAIVSITSVVQKAHQNTYLTMEKNIKEAAEGYLIDNIDLVPSGNVSLRIAANTLISNQYIKPFDDPCDATNSYVEVKRVANSVNLELDYDVCLKCNDYASGVCQP